MRSLFQRRPSFAGVLAVPLLASVSIGLGADGGGGGVIPGQVPLVRYSSAPPAPTPPPDNPVTDSFERQSLGSDWTVYFGSVGVVNQSDLGLTARSGVGIVSWAGSAIGANQFSEGVISSDKVNNMLIQVFTRRRTSDFARYGFQYDNDSGDIPAWQIKYDGVPSAQTRILASNTTAPEPRPGDTLRLEARGTNPVELKGYRNGVLVLSATDADSSAVTGGTPGLAFRLQVGTSTTYPTPVFESWRGGTPPARLLPGACANRQVGSHRSETLQGTSAGDALLGRGGADELLGRGGRDCLLGGSGNDRLSGGSGNDRLSGGRGRNRYSAGKGKDTVNARNGQRERVDCGPGGDKATVDRSDRARRCERVRRR